MVASLYLNREWDAAISEAQRALELNPSDAPLYRTLGYAHVANGGYEEGIEAFEKARKLDPEGKTTGLAFAHARAGHRDQALEWLDRLPDDPQGLLVLEVARVYGELGELDRAYGYLERLAEEDPQTLGSLRRDLAADSLRADPRYEPLMRRLGLEP